MNLYPVPTYSTGSPHTQTWPLLTWDEHVEFQWELHRQEVRLYTAETNAYLLTFEWHELRASADPLSFAHAMLDEDDGFCAAFPGARRAAIDRWALDHFLEASHIAPPTPQTNHFFTFMSPTAAMPHAHHALPPAHHPTYNVLHSTNVEAHTSLLPLWTDGAADLLPDNVYHVGDLLPSPPPPPPPSPEIVPIAPHLEVRSQRRGGDQLPPPQFTGDWEADAIAAEKLLGTSQPSHPGPVVPSMNRQDPPLVNPHAPRPGLIQRTHQTARSRSHSHASSTSRSPSAPRARPSRTRNHLRPLRYKNGKPAMACLFCRGRKIACRPPRAGSSSSTCGQCEQRDLECVYPAENRHGMRKPKEDRNLIHAMKRNSGGGEVKNKDNGGRLVHVKKAKYSEPEDIGMSDVDDSGSEWDGHD